jgi:hypothetical protein
MAKTLLGHTAFSDEVEHGLGSAAPCQRHDALDEALTRLDDVIGSRLLCELADLSSEVIELLRSHPRE